MSHDKNNAEETCLKNLTEGGSSNGNPTSFAKDETRGIGREASALNERDGGHLSAPCHTITAEESACNVASDGRNDDEDFPEGGLRAWLVVLGSFCALFMVFGIVNSTGAFQDYFSSNQLRGHASSEIGWIFSLNLFLVFFCGLYVGRIFDTHGPRILVAVGSLLLVLSIMMLGFCTSLSLFQPPPSVGAVCRV
jgi:hypothetical protein